MWADISNFELADSQVLPERSPLFTLEPIGVGQVNAECLTSYVQRLMDAHQVDFERLINKAILPRIRKKQWEIATHYPGEHLLNTGWIEERWYYSNPMTDFEKNTIKQKRQATKILIKALESSTFQKGLVQLTMIPLEKIAPALHSLRRVLAWCPECLSELHQEGRTTYFPLLWSIKNVVVCTKHKRFLMEGCPICNALQALFPSKNKLGTCYRCGGLLRDDTGKFILSNRYGEMKSDEDLDWYLWVATYIEDLLLAASRFENDLPKRSVKKTAIKNIVKLNESRYELLNKSNLQRERLSFDELLEIAFN